MIKALLFASLCILLKGASVESFASVSTLDTCRKYALNSREAHNHHLVDVPKTPRRVIVGRRSFIGAGAASVGLLFFKPFLAQSMPSATTKEFQTLLQESARSVQSVEFSGPKSETVVVRLVDGTIFGINDVVESSYDPRSPLKIAAMCRDNKIPTKFSGIEEILSKSPKRKKVYMNERVQEAAQKEKAKRERIAKDEEERLAEIYRLEEEEANQALEDAK